MALGAEVCIVPALGIGTKGRGARRGGRGRGAGQRSERGRVRRAAREGLLTCGSDSGKESRWYGCCQPPPSRITVRRSSLSQMGW